MPDSACYAAAISCCEGSQQWEEALSLYEEMRNYGLTPEASTYPTVSNALAATGAWRQSLRFLDELKEPSLAVLGPAAAACAASGQWQQALQLLSDVRQKQMRPDMDLYKASLRAAADGKQWEQALQLLQECHQRGFELPTASTNDAMAACLRSGQWGAAYDIFEDPALNADADAEGYGMALEASNQLGCWGNSLTLLEEGRARGIRPNAAMHNFAVQACAAKQEWASALLLLGEMRSLGQRPDSETISRTVDLMSSRIRANLADESPADKKWRSLASGLCNV
ncbi:PPR10, partial [Symbiodinium microadriaticum]